MIPMILIVLFYAPLFLTPLILILLMPLFLKGLELLRIGHELALARIKETERELGLYRTRLQALTSF
jgi:hypothetical protein